MRFAAPLTAMVKPLKMADILSGGCVIGGHFTVICMIAAPDVPDEVRWWQQRVLDVLGEQQPTLIATTAQWGLISGAHNAGVWRLRFDGEKPPTFAVKYTGGDDSAERLAGEAAGLQALAATQTVRVPSVLTYGEDYLISEWLPTVEAVDVGETNTGAWQAAGRALAALHEVPQASCGFHCPTHCGPTKQDNRPTTNAGDALAWFGERRLVAMAVQGAQRETWPSSIVDQVEDLALKLDELCPAQQPSLCHGDLWSGNAQLSCDAEGKLAIGFLTPPLRVVQLKRIWQWQHYLVVSPRNFIMLTKSLGRL